MSRKMSLKKRLIDRDRFHAHAFRYAFVEAENPIDHQKRITMRQNLHDLIGLEPAVAFRDNARNGQRVTARLFLRNRVSEFSVRCVPRFYGNEMTANAATDEREVADDVENFVPDEFVRETQRLFA